MQEKITAMQQLINTLIGYGVQYGFQVLGAIIILILGTLAANWISGLVYASMQSKLMDVTLSKFLAGVVKLIVLGFAIIIAMGNFGITITPFIATLSAMAFGTSFAIQGPISNYGSGLSIIFSRPFVVGNTITVAGVTGIVKEIQLACTILTGSDGQQITVPNKDIVGKIIENSFQQKLVAGEIGIGYDSKIEDAISLIQGILRAYSDINPEKIHVGIKAFGDFSIQISYLYFVPTARAGSATHAVNLAIFNGLTKARISIPYPRQDVRILSNAASPAGL
ncbi:MAG: mechanosensitive ion channel family protein [Candidatus Omnitrophica bacterium]|nr:mechanosensitive ion channel family protein [Candidatus Omnitrophota bacterium]